MCVCAYVSVCMRVMGPSQATEINLLFQHTVSSDCFCVEPNPETHIETVPVLLLAEDSRAISHLTWFSMN